MTKAQYQAASFQAAVELAGRPNYLGDPAVVVNILRDVAKEWFRHWEEPVADVDLALKADTDTCERAAKIFLGLDTNYTPIPTYNVAGGINNFVADALGCADTDPLTRLAFLFMTYLSDLLALVSAAKNGDMLDDQLQQQSNRVMAKYRDLLMGIPFSPGQGTCVAAKTEAASRGE